MTLETKTDLFPYQEAVIKKLLPIRIGAMYMEMGTGKTRTALEIIKIRQQKGKIDQVLWLCPCSVKQNLKEDLDKHSAGWQSLIRIEGIESLSGSDRLYLDLLKVVGKKTMVIVDESNLVKNYFAKRTKRITEIGKTAKYRMILNGTPVSKNEADLYAQWYFLDYRIFGYRTFWSFAANHLEKDEYGKIRRVLNVDYLSEKIAPYSVVIKKRDVVNLPDKKTIRERFWVTDAQLAHYSDIADEMLLQADPEDSTTIYRTFTALQLIASGRRITSTGKPLQSEPFFDDPNDNPRIQKFLWVLPDEGKCLVWVKFRHESEELQQVLPAGSFAVFTGEVNQKQRMKNLDRFRSDPDCRFLIANKVCGGYGLNLQFCHQAIYYNNDFNFATRAQSEDRIHRLGQDHKVILTDILSDLRIDERIINCLDKKESLVEAFKRELKARKGAEFLNDKNRIEHRGKKEGHSGPSE